MKTRSVCLAEALYGGTSRGVTTFTFSYRPVFARRASKTGNWGGKTARRAQTFPGVQTERRYNTDQKSLFYQYKNNSHIRPKVILCVLIKQRPVYCTCQANALVICFPHPLTPGDG